MDAAQTIAAPSTHPAWNLLALALVPCMVIVLLAGSLPPGVLWQEEGFGYDVLSYHLAVPKAWFEQGRVTVLPYNAYSAFPFNSEMLSLLMMVLRGDGIEAAFMAQLANVALAALFVAAAWKLGRLYGRIPAIVAALTAGTCPWIAYLCGIAYSEPGMLAMGMTALWAAFKAGHVDHGPRGRWVLIAGLLAGLACGYKYTALPLIALPIGVLLAITLAEQWTRRALHLTIYAAACLATFSPWLIRNQIVCGNPIYPLGYSVFGAKPGWWDDELEERWQRAHGSAEAERTATSMPQRIWLHTLAEPRTGALVWALAVGGICLRRDRRTLALLAVLAVQLAVWIAATHLFARFACVLLLPLIALAARMAERPMARRTAGMFAGVVILGAGLNLYHLVALYYDHVRIGPERQLIDAYGRTHWFEQGAWPGTQYVATIDELPGSAKVMLVGEARTYYLRRACTYASAFNHHPLAQAAQEYADDDALMHWLKQCGISHVLFQWDEIHRLRATYGMDGAINAGLLPRLEAGGLKHTASFTISQGSPPYASLFEVPTP